MPASCHPGWRSCVTVAVCIWIMHNYYLIGCALIHNIMALLYFLNVSFCSVFLLVCFSMSMCTSVCLCLFLCFCLSGCMFVFICLSASVCMSVFIYLSLSICLYMSVCLPICLHLPVCMSVCHWWIVSSGLQRFLDCNCEVRRIWSCCWSRSKDGRGPGQLGRPLHKCMAAMVQLEKWVDSRY